MWLAMSDKVHLFLGGEFYPLDTRQLVGAHLPLLAHLTALAFIFMHRRPQLSQRTRELFPIMLVVAAMAAGSKRFVEYAVPVATLFCAFFAEDVLAGWTEQDLPSGKRAALALAFAAAVAVGSGVETWMIRSMMRKVNPPRFESLARSLAARAPQGAMVFTCDWDEPPEFFFYADGLRYPVMMDPTFMYYWDPTVWKRWSDVANARLSPDETVRALTKTFSARFGVCGSKFHELRSLIARDPRFHVLQEDRNGYLFTVEEAAPALSGK